MTIIIFESKKKNVGRLKHRNKKEAKNVMIRFKNRHIKGEKHICSNGFYRISQKIRRSREQQSFL